ncbi:hypothetical protein JM658_06525 [Joostella atrarenae]|uniref:Uncharacterized protein n=1 Tax=Joostella atrarenae TaxID=679257 RepID=A0ABS9J237_9FLAO|nr:hypothetical protein [Joostella atrarenae]MCF8714484.1 hypothetical protein [Joostella atrarenae]
MNRNHRNILAENLRHYLSGTITNFEFMDRIEPIYRTDDKGVRAVESEFWFCYDDLRKHKNIGKDKLTVEAENHIKRFILFLKSDNEYEWKDPKFSNPFKWILNLITIKRYPKKSEKNELKNEETGDGQVWPFFRQTEFEKEINEPKYLNG